MDQLHIAPLNNITAGGLIGVFPEARQTIEGAVEEFFAGFKPLLRKRLIKQLFRLLQPLKITIYQLGK